MKIIGHRGARGLAPENTIVSLRKALKHDVDELEFDLRVTHDNIVILHHDPEVVDQSGTKLQIASHAYGELKQHKSDLATLDEVISEIGHAVPLLIEVKPGVPLQQIIKIVTRCFNEGWKPQDILFASFSQAALRKLHTAFPEVQMVVNEKWSGTRAVLRARELGTRRLSMNQKWLWRGFIKPMKRRGWELYPYTLNDPKKAARWERYGIAGVITDYPDRYQ